MMEPQIYIYCFVFYDDDCYFILQLQDFYFSCFNVRFAEPGIGELIVTVSIALGDKGATKTCKVKEQKWKVQVNATSITAFTHNLEFPDVTVVGL
jgi:hypothetical protein